MQTFLNDRFFFLFSKCSGELSGVKEMSVREESGGGSGGEWGGTEGIT